jgi:hypothetical protein
MIADLPFPYHTEFKAERKRRALAKAQALSRAASCSKATQRVDTIQA